MGHEHKGYRIDVRCFRASEGGWRPDIRLAIPHDGRLTERQLVTPPERLFPTAEQAEEYGLRHAVLWIDTYLTDIGTAP